MAETALINENGDLLVNESGDALAFSADGTATPCNSEGQPIGLLLGLTYTCAGGDATPCGNEGEPMGLLLALTYSCDAVATPCDNEGEPMGLLLALTYTCEAPTPAPEVAPDPAGRITGGWFSRKKWHDLKDLLEAQRRVEELAEEKKGKEAKALDKAADRAAQALELVHQADLDELNQFARMQTLLEAAAQAETMTARIRAANQAAVVATRIIRDLEEEEEAIAFFLLN